jgi:5-formyltetrahydrofolate cyclo-ligase
MQPLTKHAARTWAGNQRRLLSPKEILQYNEQLLDRFTGLPLGHIHYLHSFIPIPTHTEPNTMLLLNWLRSHHAGVQVVLSRSDPALRLMRHFLWDEHTVLQTNRWGIPEPVGGTEVHAAMLDVVLVPLLAFDRHGNRVGYGKGFYDRFLAQCRPESLKIGLSFFGPLHEISDVSEHDIRMDACITPGKLWWFTDKQL